jgi:hypothetical protein
MAPDRVDQSRSACVVAHQPCIRPRCTQCLQFFVVARALDESQATYAAGRLRNERGTERRGRHAVMNRHTGALRTDLAWRHGVERHGQIV